MMHVTINDLRIFNEIKNMFPERKLIFLEEIKEKIYKNNFDHSTLILIGLAMSKSGWNSRKFGKKQLKYYYVPGITPNEEAEEMKKYTPSR